MSPVERAAYIFAQAVCALAEIEGMKAANAERAITHNDAPVFGKAHFDAVANKYGIHHNAVIGYFQA